MKGHGNNRRDRLAGAAMRFQPDSRLVDLAQEGHERAFEEIVRRYRPALVSFAGGIVPDRHAEDVVQEALTKAHSALGRSDAAINLRPWLYTIVRNRALNALRDEPAYDHLDENFDGVAQPPEVAARREELAALTARVRDLPDPQRQALVKRELEGRSHEEIASSLGVSAGAVRGLISRARTALRDGAGMLIPMPVLRALLGSGSSAPEATGAAAAATGIAAGGGGIAVKAGATLGVAVIAVGSGIAIQHRASGGGDEQAASDEGGAHHSRVQAAGESSAAGSSGGLTGREAESGHGGPGPSDSSGPGGGGGSSGSSSGPGSGSGGASSGEGSGSDDGGQSGGSSGSDDGGSGTGSDSGSSGSGSSGSDSSGSGSSGSGSSGDGTSDTSGTSGSGTSGSGTSGSGTSGSGDDSGSSGSGTSGSGEISTTTSTTSTTTTTSTDGSGGSGSG
jgi:RNA polymerase sigma factor (sigma-70 family)